MLKQPESTVNEVPHALNLAQRPERAPIDIFIAAVGPAPVPMLLTDPAQSHNPIVFANQAFISLTGYAQDEVIGRTCSFLQGPGTDPASVLKTREAINARQDLSIELLNYRKDGSSFWNALFISPVFDSAGNLIYFFGSQLDVSRWHGAEEALAQAQKLRPLSRGALEEGHLKRPISSHLVLAALSKWRELNRLALDAEKNASCRAISYSGGAIRSFSDADLQLAKQLRDAAIRARNDAFELIDAIR